MIIFFFEKVSRKSKLRQNLTVIRGTLHEDLCTLLITFLSVLIRMGNVSDKSCGENQNAYFLCSIIFFRKSCLYVISGGGGCCWAGQATDDNMIRRMRVAYWLAKATNTHSQCVLLIAFFFHCNSGSANAPECYVIRSLPGLLQTGGPSRTLAMCMCKGMHSSIISSSA